MYVITGATGHTGSVITERLLAAGKKVRVVGRNVGKLERFRVRGAEVFIADVTDQAALARAFSDNTAVYAMLPGDPSAPDIRGAQERASDALSAAIEESGIPFTVLLSSIGADKSAGTGPVVGLHNFEKKLDAIAGLNVLSLRAGYFMENLLPQLEVIRSYGIVAGPLRGDLKVPMIATHDIGEAAAKALLDLSFSGKSTRELQGARDVTYTEVTAVIASAIGKPGLSYQQMPPAQLKPALMSMGMSASMADLLLEMADSLNAGYMKALEPRSAANTTPTTIEKFVADQFVPAYRTKAAGA